MARRSSGQRAVLDNADILIVPGRGGSSYDHWQSHFEREHDNARRVQQSGWETPELDAWAERIASASRASEGQVLAIAHSFGCLAAVHAILAIDAPIDALMLVAPVDPDRFGIAWEHYAHNLRVPSVLVTSMNDPWLRAARAVKLAATWGSDYVNLGNSGHINLASGYGHWKDCARLAASLLRKSALHSPLLGQPRERIRRTVYAAL